MSKKALFCFPKHISIVWHICYSEVDRNAKDLEHGLKVVINIEEAAIWRHCYDRFITYL